MALVERERGGAERVELSPQAGELLCLLRGGGGGAVTAPAHHEPHRRAHADWTEQDGKEEEELFHKVPSAQET